MGPLIAWDRRRPGARNSPVGPWYRHWPRPEAQDHESLAVGGLAGQGGGLLQVIEEILGGGCTQGEAVMGQGKLRILGGSLSQKLPGVMAPEILRQGTALQVLLLRVSPTRW